MGSDRDDELPDVHASGASLIRILYRELVTIILLSVFWTVASLPVVTVGGATLALCDVMTRVIMDRSEDRLVTERERVRAFVGSFRRNVRRGLPLSAILAALLFSFWSHLNFYAANEQWIFSSSAFVGLYLVVIGVTWTFRAASVIIRVPDDDRPGTIRAFLDGADLALEYPYYSVLHLLTVGAALVLASLEFVAVLLLVPATLAAVEVISFEELTDHGAADISRRYSGLR